MDAGSLAHTPPPEEEPDEPNDAVIDVLAEAEAIVDASAPATIADVERTVRPRRPWWRRRSGPDDGDDFRLSNH